MRSSSSPAPLTLAERVPEAGDRQQPSADAYRIANGVARWPLDAAWSTGTEARPATSRLAVRFDRVTFCSEFCRRRQRAATAVAGGIHSNHLPPVTPSFGSVRRIASHSCKNLASGRGRSTRATRSLDVVLIINRGGVVRPSELS